MSKNYTIAEVAKKIRVSERTILREIKRGKLKTNKAGRRYLISQSQLDGYLGKGEPDVSLAIDTYLHSKKTEMVALLQRLVALPSESEDPEQEKLAHFLKNLLEKYGFRTSIYGKGDSSVARASYGYKDKGVLLDCPLDTAPIGQEDKWTYSPFDGVVKKGKLYGRGAVDCKAGMVAMIFALRALKKYVSEDDIRVELLFDGGEHSGEYNGMREAIKRGINASCGIIGYGGSGNDIALGCRGYHRYTFTSYGHSVHTGARYKSGVNAIQNMAELISDLDSIKFPKPVDKYFKFGSKLTVAKIAGGQAINVVPDECVAEVDVRTVPSMNREQVEELLQDVIKSAKHRHKGLNVNFKYMVGQTGYRVDEDHPLVVSLSKSVQSKKGNRPAFVVHGPGHIGTLLHKQGIPMVVYGPDGGNIHSYDEYVELDSIPQTAAIYADTVIRYFNIS